MITAITICLLLCAIIAIGASAIRTENKAKDMAHRGEWD